jgi:hypothetical protein
LAASTLANLTSSLRRIYSDEFFEVAINTAAPFWMDLQEEKNLEPEGEGYFWPFYLATPQNIGTPAEEANLPTVKQRSEVQGRVRPGQFIATFEISFILEAVGSTRGAWNKGEVKRHMWEAITDLTKHVNRIYAGTHGTGRIGVVSAVSGATFTAGTGTTTSTLGPAGTDETVGAHLLRRNMTLEFRADDTGTGADHTPATAPNVTKIVQSTRVVTTDQTLAAVVAGDHVYIKGSYGQATVPNGIMGIVDDGSLLDVIHNAARSTNEELKAKVDSSSSLRPLSEELLIRNAFDVYQLSGQYIDTILMNSGEIERYLAFVRPDRRYPVMSGGKGVPDYKVGYDEDSLEFLYGGKRAKIKMMVDVPPRTVLGITKSMLRRFTLRKMTWYDHGGGQIFVQGVNSGGLKTTKQATLIHLDNLGSLMPRSAFRIRDLTDPQLAGASYGGSDT